MAARERRARLSIRRAGRRVVATGDTGRADLPKLPRMDTQAMLRASWRHWWDRSAPRAGPAWLQLLWTALFSAGLAVIFTIIGFALYAQGDGAWHNLAGWAYWYGRNLIVSMTIGYCIQALHALVFVYIGAPRIQAMPAWRRGLLFAAVPMTGVLMGWPLGFQLAGGDFAIFARMNANSIAASVLLSIVVSWAFHVYWTLRTREMRAQMRAAESQLRLLQAQMEPHFLFNTLANVISLIEIDAPRARRTLEAFTDYLRASLGSLRGDVGTLAGELELAERYLSLMQARMEERLRFTIDCDPALRQASLPPLLLQPLVENAVQHGLEPQVDGGQVHISARLQPARPGQDARIELTVDDDGRDWSGHAPPPRRSGRSGNGVALENLRARLLARYGQAAALTLEPRSPGTRARLVVPFAAAAGPACATLVRRPAA